jgi:hypothetical protein
MRIYRTKKSSSPDLYANLYPLIKDYLVCWYKFDDVTNLKDWSKNGLNLTRSGKPTMRQFDYLGRKSAVLFTPATSDYFYHSNDALFNFGTSDFVIWGILKTTNATDYISLMHKRVAGAEGFAFYKRDNAGVHANKLEFDISDNIPTVKAIISDSAINDGNYHLAEIVADRSANCAMFLDGVAQIDIEDISAVGSISNIQQFCIGRNSAIANMHYDGLISETLIIKGSPLPDWILLPAFAQQVYKWTGLGRV